MAVASAAVGAVLTAHNDLGHAQIYDPIEARFFGLVRWLALLLLQKRNLPEIHRRNLHKCLHAIDAAGSGLSIPTAVARALASGELYELFAAMALGDGHPPETGTPNATRAHAAALEHLKRGGAVPELCRDSAGTVAALSASRPLARDVHGTVMAALVDRLDAARTTLNSRAPLALPAAVASEVSRFAPYSASSEQPHDAEDAISLWLAKVASCVNGVAQKESATVPLPIMHDFFAACRDGRVVTALLVYYRPDLARVDQLLFETAAAADAAAAVTTEAALRAASRASCPCPLTAADFARQSPLLRPVALSWLSAAFFKLSELPLSTRLPLATNSDSRRTPRPRSARPTSARPSTAGSQRPMSRKGRAHDADREIGLGATSPRQTSAGRPPRTPTHSAQRDRRYSAETLALVDTAHARRPHATIRAASRPPSAGIAPRDRYANGSGRTSSPRRDSPPSLRRTASPKGVHSRAPETAESALIEVSTWRDDYIDAEDEMTVRQLDSFVTDMPVTPDRPLALAASDLGTPPSTQDLAETLAETKLAETTGRPAAPATPPGPPSIGVTSPQFQVYPTATDIHPPATLSSATVVHSIDVARPASIKPVSHPPVPAALPDMGVTLGNARQSPAPTTLENESEARNDLLASIPSPQSLNGRREETLQGVAATEYSHSPGAAIDNVAESGRPRSRRSSITTPGRLPRRSISPAPETRKLARKLSQTLVAQLGRLPLQDDEDEASAESPPPRKKGSKAKGKTSSKSKKSPSPTAKTPTQRGGRSGKTPTPTHQGMKTSRPSTAKSDGKSGKRAARASESHSMGVDSDDGSFVETDDDVELGSEAENPDFHEVFGDLQHVPAQVRDTLVMSEQETFEALRASMLEASNIDMRASYTVTKGDGSNSVDDTEQRLTLPKVDSNYTAFFVDASSPSNAAPPPSVPLQRTPTEAECHEPEVSVHPTTALTPTSVSGHADVSSAHEESGMAEDTAELVELPSSVAHDASPTPTSPHRTAHVAWEFPASRGLRQALGVSWAAVEEKEREQQALFNATRAHIFEVARTEPATEGRRPHGGHHVDSPTNLGAHGGGEVVKQMPTRTETTLHAADVKRPNSHSERRVNEVLSESSSASKAPIQPTLTSTRSASTVPRAATVVAATAVHETKTSAAFDVQLGDEPTPESRARQHMLAERQRKRLTDVEQRALTKARPPNSVSEGVHGRGRGTTSAAVPATDAAVVVNDRAVTRPAHMTTELVSPPSPPKNASSKDRKQRSNRQLVRNAITYTCLAGQVNARALETVTNKLDKSTATHFLIMLHDQNDLKFRAVYEYDFDTLEARKLSGRGPARVAAESMVHTFRYNSGTRRFSPTRSVEVTNLVDAFCIPPSRTKKNPAII